MTARWMHPPELDPQRDRARFDPVEEGERYELSEAVSLAVWRHARHASTNERGECDEWRAAKQFRELAARLGARGGRLLPDVGRATRVGVELLGDVPALMRPGGLETGVPGRTTLVLEATRWQTLEAPAEPPLDTASERRLLTPAPIGPPVRRDQPRPLDEAASRQLGALFGFDFHATRVVPDSPAATGSTKDVTKDGEAHFRAGAYQPETPDGLRLLAHELTHVVQQRAGGGRTGTRSQLEREADTAAGLVARGQMATVAMRAPAGVSSTGDDSFALALSSRPSNVLQLEAIRYDDVIEIQYGPWKHFGPSWPGPTYCDQPRPAARRWRDARSAVPPPSRVAVAARSVPPLSYPDVAPPRTANLDVSM